MFGSSEISLLKKALRLYAGELVLNRVLALKEKAFGIGGEPVHSSVMFSDIASMTPVTENCDPSALAVLINKYIAVVTSAISTHGGVIDSLSGDAISAYWLGENHPVKACACAGEILEKVGQLNSSSTRDGFPEIKPRIGINTGNVLLGNYGSPDRLRFTVLGDAVNIASRLCALASGNYNFPIVIAESTRLSLPPSFVATEIESVRVKGMAQAIKLYGLGEV